MSTYTNILVSLWQYICKIPLWKSWLHFSKVYAWMYVYFDLMYISVDMVIVLRQTISLFMCYISVSLCYFKCTYCHHIYVIWGSNLCPFFRFIYKCQIMDTEKYIYSTTEKVLLVICSDQLMYCRIPLFNYVL